MTYTEEDLNRDMTVITELGADKEPEDIYMKIQWEMARVHKLIVRHWIQIHKQFNTSAPIDDAENYFGYAGHWVHHHHSFEEEISFPRWAPNLSTTTEQSQHKELMTELYRFQEYIAAVTAKSEPWSATKAEAHAQALLPPLMSHLVGELHTLDPDALRRSGLTAEALTDISDAVIKATQTSLDMHKDIPALLLHNDGDLDWPTTTWQRTAEFTMPPELYKPYAECVFLRYICYW
ncbi:hypothetical protein SCP_1203590 [Sparassis crispa]|uniref:Hemerythrin-like domain-containing protein n=1 Tax=Sparassis crispa TaxID=139825 RepID=A0A401H164_9APHY|nr:hypothetical protein SCP_1203590 [Sparassis crispa]GBE88129.1 hypothetical protein SCP_1203590 [Sparassis crispa]